jgi:hypothetical protein
MIKGQWVINAARRSTLLVKRRHLRIISTVDGFFMQVPQEILCDRRHKRANERPIGEIGFSVLRGGGIVGA